MLLQTSLPSLPLRELPFQEEPLLGDPPSINRFSVLLNDNILIFGNLWKDISVMIDFSFFTLCAISVRARLHFYSKLCLVLIFA